MNEGQKKLIEDYPIHVGFPKLAGRYLLLDWDSYHTKHCAAVAKTEPALVTEFNVAIGRNNDARPVAAYQIDIVSPPEEMQLVAAKAIRKHDIAMFESFVAHKLAMLLKTDGALPPGFKQCKRVVREGGEHPYNCTDCHQDFLYNVRRLYETKRDLYHEIGSGYYIQFKRPSSAPACDPERNLFVVRTGMSDSVLVQVFKKEYAFWSSQEVLFFCHATEIPMPPAILELRAQKDEDLKQRDALYDQAQRERYEKDKAREIAHARRFFA
jgi:hypothetical protein